MRKHELLFLKKYLMVEQSVRIKIKNPIVSAIVSANLNQK